MKLNLFNLLILLAPIGVAAQSFIGLNTDNFNGVHGVLSNPANVVDSRTKIDINLFGLSGYLSNDYASVDLGSLDDIDFDEDENLDPSNSNNSLLNLDVLGPSVLFNIDANNAVALTTRARVFLNVNNIPGSTIELFDSGIDENNPVLINDISLNSTGHAWTEYGATYGRVIFDKGTHFLKAGITAKYLSGYGFVNGESQNVSLDYDPGFANPAPAPAGQLTANGNASYSFSENFDLDGDNEVFENDDDFEIRSEASGVGFDLGVVYEYRKNEDNKGLKYKNKYFLKAGFSLTDIGSLKYKNSRVTEYTINQVNFDQNTLDNGGFEDFENLVSLSQSTASKKIKLPAAMHLNVDWNAYKKLYINLNTDLSLIGKETADANRIENSVAVTPRFESRWFSFYSPIGIRQFSGFNWGAGLRAGPLYVGSGSILSNVISDESKSIDIYAGLKIPIYYSKGRTKKIKDKDGDGVADKEDDCPEVAGIAANNGCPKEIIDTDKDGVEDDEDKCPNIFGQASNNGCPEVVDIDGDGIEDSKDECPEEFGVVENNGCPEVVDTDEDGVPNVLDRCPEVFGVATNGGCPEVKTLVAESKEAKEVEKTLESYAKVINFNSGKSSFTTETYSALSAIQAILSEYPKAKFDINGYTDSVGSERSNQLLSEERANAVKAHFIEKGITASRLKATGYGEANPIASNATVEGRKTNRRVEIKVAK